MPLGCGGKPAVNKHRMNKELSQFAARLRGLIALPDSGYNGQPSSERFDSLALELFALQYEHNSAYRKICDSRRMTPKVVEHWTQIPFVPTAAFKELELSSIPPHERIAVFHSSGTTEQKPSQHFHSAESLSLYEASLWQWFGVHFRGGNQFVFLAPKPGTAPRSSLVHMFETIQTRSEAGGEFYGDITGDGAWTIDFEAVVRVFNSPCSSGKPLTILGTAFSFVHLLDYLAENNLRFTLPPGSRIMETGGYKNRSRIMPKTELHALISQHLGVPRQQIICEYGMSELSSQAYDSEFHSPSSILHPRTFHFPPWARAQIISPETSQEVPDGKPGLIRIFDLANVFSVAAVQTEDLGICFGEHFELIGRAQLAEPRGCSLMSA